LFNAPLGPFVLLSELLTPGHVVVPMAATDKRGAIAELARRLAERSGGDYDDVHRAVVRREQELSTGIGFGVAIPHGKSPTVSELSVVAGVAPAPVPFDALDDEPVRLFFMIVGPEASAGQHVKVLSRIARLVRHDDVRERLLRARTPEEFQHALLLAEER
jgi:mannitol/fructose-specific phosphotransferase system IIA component (Ntr-type)